MSHHPTQIEVEFVKLVRWVKLGVVVLLALLLATLVGCRADSAKANKQAEQYMQHVKGATGYECVPKDSDGDGYCSCTIFRDNQDPLPILCGCEPVCLFDCADGCKYVPYAGGKR